jgi:hypothetical protein
VAKKKTKDELECNKPVKSWRPGKKMAVKGCQDGKERIVHFGDTQYEDFRQHKDKDRRANFRKRHNCSEQKDKLSAAYWACSKLW